MVAMLHERKFSEFDPQEMVKLKALQQRATQYVLYYTKFSKSRLKFCLIEDAIQYNIQLTMFIMSAFSTNIETDDMDYSGGSMDFYLRLHPIQSYLRKFVVKIFQMSTSALSMWLGIYMTERFHEQLMTGK